MYETSFIINVHLLEYIVIQPLYYHHCASFHYDSPNDGGDIRIENFISSKLLPVAKYLVVAISLRFGEIASLKRIFFFDVM